jgi:hypothetical protein
MIGKARWDPGERRLLWKDSLMGPYEHRLGGSRTISIESEGPMARAFFGGGESVMDDGGEVTRDIFSICWLRFPSFLSSIVTETKGLS